jgi:hypothetical protein
MNENRRIQDPQFDAFAEAAAAAIEEGLNDIEIPLPRLSLLGEILGRIVPRPVLQEALAVAAE